MTIKLNVIIAVVLFLSLPFIYNYLAFQNNIQFLYSTFVIYLVAIPSAVIFAKYLEKNMSQDLTADAKKNLFLTGVILLCIYAFYLFVMTYYLYENYFSQGIDLTYFQQYIWQLSEFKIPYGWLLTTRTFPIWSQHFSPFLALLVPSFWLSHSSGLLFMEQAIAVISGAIPIYLISKRYLHSRGLGIALSFAYLSFGGLQFGMEYGFHEIMFFPVVFLWAYYFYIAKKKYLYFLFIFFSLLIKEEVSFIVMFWGLYLFLIRKDRIFGIITAAMGLLWSYICFSIVFPYFNKGGFGYWEQYTGGGAGLGGMFKAIIFNPLNFLQTLVTPDIKVTMMLETFGQFGYLLLLFPPAIIIIVPSLMEKLMSTNIAGGNGAHYSAAICTVTIIATIEALPHISKYKFISKYIHNKNLFFAVLIFYASFFSNILVGFPDYSLIPNHPKYFLETAITDDNKMLLNQIVNKIPQNATVSSNTPIPQHLNKYYKDYSGWPGMVGTEDFVIIDTQFQPVYGTSGKVYNDDINKLNNNKNYQLVVANYGILVYQRKSYKINGAN